MQLFLDSSDLRESEKALKTGILNGVITNPEMMKRYGEQDTDALILKLSKQTEILQIDPSGNSIETWTAEAIRLLSLGLEKEKTVFRVPVTLEGIQTCKELSSKGILVNVHYVYTLQQAYLALQSGAAYVTLMISEIQDQGHDALEILVLCLEMKDRYGYAGKILFGSARTQEHVRNAITLGADALAIPISLYQSLRESLLTNQGAEKYLEQSRMRIQKVKDVIRNSNPKVHLSDSILDAVVEMTKGGMGAVAVLNSDESIAGVFTDGDLRRLVQSKGNEVLQTQLSDLSFKQPVSVDSNAPLDEAAAILRERRIDNILVLSDGKLLGMLDIQDLNKG
jgi:transaldolase